MKLQMQGCRNQVESFGLAAPKNNNNNAKLLPLYLLLLLLLLRAKQRSQ